MMSESVSTAVSTRAALVIGAIRADLRRPWSVGEMGAVIGVTDSHLRRIFARGLGRSPKDVLNDLRLEAAATLLANPAVRIKEVHDTVGIQDSSHFSRRFRRRYGVSPKEFRSEALLVLLRTARVPSEGAYQEVYTSRRR